MNVSSFEPNWFSKPGDTLATLLKQRDISPHKLAELLECDERTVRGILAGIISIDKSLSQKLSAIFGGGLDFWRARQSDYDDALTRIAERIPSEIKKSWVKNFPFNEMEKFGWLEQRPTIDESLRFSLAYFGVTTPEEWKTKYANFLQNVDFRTSPSFDSKIGALTTWLRQGEIEAALVSCGAWNKELLLKQLEEIRALTKVKSPHYFMPRLQKLCAAAGVAVVYVRTPVGCRASGAARFVSNDRAMIILSFRHLTDDHFWFTFFHEMGHLILHGEDSTFVDAESTNLNEKEKDANSFAASALVPHEYRDEMLGLFPKARSIIRFAISIGVSPGIVVGQLQHLGVIGRNQLNFLKRRYEWSEISEATTNLGNV